MRPSRLATACLVLIVAAAAGWSSGPGDDVIEQRRARLEQMTDAQKTAILDKKRRFEDLSDEQQDQLRKLHEELAAHPNCDRLRKLLQRYNDWLRTLPPGTKAEILSLPTAERVARIEKDITKPDPQRFQRFFGSQLTREDLNVINQWLDQFIDDHITEIVAALPEGRFDEIKKGYDPDKHRRRLAFILFQLESPNLPRPSREDEQRLQESLSQEARNALKNAANEEERSRMLGHWIRGADFVRKPFFFSKDELDKFVATLDASQRERLENLPRDRMHWELQVLYFRQWYSKAFGDPMGGPSGRRGGPGSGRFPGDGRGWPNFPSRPPDQPPPGMGPPAFEGPGETGKPAAGRSGGSRGNRQR